MARIAIEVRNTFFTVNILDRNLSHILKTICSSLTTYKYVYNRRTRSTLKQKDKSFYTHIAHTNEYRFSIQMLPMFMRTLSFYGLTRAEISARIHKTYDIAKLNVKWNKNFIMRAYQKRYIKALLDMQNPIGLIDLKTGMGKSAIGMKAISRLNMRTAILILPKYIQKWIDDVKKYTDVKDDEIYVVQGSDSLVQLMEMKDIKYKFIIFSMRTVSNYITSYEDHEFTYPVLPQDLMKHLGVGSLLNDETHQHFHAVYKASLYFDVKRFIGLSATLDSNQKDIKEIYYTLFPTKNRISGLVEYERYLLVKAIRFTVDNPKAILFKGPQGYNHNLFEQSVMRNSVLLRDYIEMIMFYVKAGYIARKKKGEKLLIFAASVRMCTILRNYIAVTYPKLDVRRYVEDDDYDNLMEADICVSTVISSGTAVDIPGLISVIQTISISSLQANLQAAGRLREIDGRDVIYYYIYAGNIKNQYKMHIDRKDAIGPTAKSYENLEYHKTIRTR
jgi:superfamily II DNA or RNA helicase